MMVTAYPVHGKAKSLEICRAFVEGCGGAVVHHATELAPGPAFFYGVDRSNVHLWHQAKRRGDFYYCDNSYFDSARQAYFRVTKDRLQHTGLGETSGERFAALRIRIQPWRAPGRWIVVCPQSVDFMKLVVEYPRDWFVDTVAALDRHKRDLRVRAWGRDKTALASTLAADLDGARCLVTWSSAAANTALLAGVPVVVGDVQCAAAIMGGSLYRLDDLPQPDDRARWAGVLADNQWTLAEMRAGLAWGKLCA
jgi:hypothetical protein